MQSDASPAACDAGAPYTLYIQVVHKYVRVSVNLDGQWNPTSPACKAVRIRPLADIPSVRPDGGRRARGPRALCWRRRPALRAPPRRRAPPSALRVRRRRLGLVRVPPQPWRHADEQCRHRLALPYAARGLRRRHMAAVAALPAVHAAGPHAGCCGRADLCAAARNLTAPGRARRRAARVPAARERRGLRVVLGACGAPQRAPLARLPHTRAVGLALRPRRAQPADALLPARAPPLRLRGWGSGSG